MLVVWAYNLDDIIATCSDFEDKLIKLVWNQRGSALASLASSAAPSASGSEQNLTEKVPETATEKEVAALAKEQEQANHSRDHSDGGKKKFFGFSYFVSNKEDVERSAQGPSYRPMRLFAPFYGGLSAALALCERFFNPVSAPA